MLLLLMLFKHTLLPRVSRDLSDPSLRPLSPLSGFVSVLSCTVCPLTSHASDSSATVTRSASPVLRRSSFGVHSAAPTAALLKNKTSFPQILNIFQHTPLKETSVDFR